VVVTGALTKGEFVMYLNECLFTHVRSYAGCLSSSKRGKLIRAYVFWCFDDLLTSAGTWSSAEYARPVTKCGTAVKAVCVRELVKAAEYFTNQKQGCCLYVW